MLEFLYKLFIGHIHKYEIIHEEAITYGGTKVGNSYIQQCKICGKLQHFREKG